jgi:putative mRNA 3-end processing factor
VPAAEAVPLQMESIPKTGRAFVYRAGVRLAGTVLACDAAAGADLVFLSHAAVLGARRRRALPRVGGGRRQILTTEATLKLLGPFGERLRTQALVTAYGRPFALGDLRLELFPSGFLPGAASLLCERDGQRLVYAGPIGDGGEVRAADALCLDARFAERAIAFPARAEAEASLLRMARESQGAGAPVFLIEPLALAPIVARALAAAGVPLRAHRAIVDAVAAFNRIGPAEAAPTVQRFAGRLAPGEVLLWPADARAPRQGGEAQARRTVLVSPRAGAAARARPAAALGLTFPFGADSAELVRYVEATGAGEVALVGAPDDALAELLRGRGIAAYRIGPPRQIDLFATP